MNLESFYRTEQKYYLTNIQFKKLINNIKDYIVKDKYFKESICSIYFDNDNNDIVINSLSKPLYKEKFRLRSYNTPLDDDIVFLEVKKKYKGVVYKRRVTMSYKDAKEYIYMKKKPDFKSQIFDEIDYSFNKYNLKPIINISYERYAYLSKSDNHFRITFDYNIRSNSKILELNKDIKGDYLLKEGYIMEIKSINPIPFWLLKELENLSIYPTNFSKYGETYKKMNGSEIYV